MSLSASDSKVRWFVGVVVMGTLSLRCGGPAPARLMLDAQVEEVSAGETTTITAMLTDDRGNPVGDFPLRFSSETTGASLNPVDERTALDGTATSVLTASPQAGDNRVVATAADLTASAVVRAVPGAPTDVSVTADPDRVPSGGISAITIRVNDAYGNPVEGVEVGLTAQNSGAELSVPAEATDRSGMVTAELTTARQPGDNLVEVTVMGLPARTVTVQGAQLSRIDLSPGSADLLAGAQQEFDAVGLDEAGDEITLRPQWFVTGDVGSIDESGRFTATKAGDGAVGATVGNATATSAVTVAPGPLGTIVLSPSETAVAAGSSVTFRSTGTDAAGNEIVIDPEWTAPSELGEISEGGTFHARIVGRGTVSASARGVTATASIAVTGGPLAMLSVEPTEIVLQAGATQQLTVKGHDGAGNEVPVLPRWSVSDQLAHVDEGGVLSARKVGTGGLIVRFGNIATRARIEITPGDLSSIRVTPRQQEVAAGTSVQFSAVGLDGYGNDVDVNASWSITTDIGEIDSNGLFTGMSAGRGVVMAQAGTLVGQTPLRVVPGEVVSLQVTPAEETVAAGSIQQFVAVGFDAGGNQATLRPQWTLTGGLGAIDADGSFRAETAGTARITARHGKSSAHASITVVAGGLATVEVQSGPPSATSGSVREFFAFGRDAHGNEVAIEPTWTVTGGIGEIDPMTGRFTAVTRGEGRIIATVGSIAGQAPITVRPGPLASIQVSPPTKFQSGQTWQFSATGFDENGNEIPVAPSWTVTGQLGDLSPTGLFTARMAGTGRVVAGVGNVTGNVGVVVLPGEIVSLDIDPSTATVAAGETVRLSAVGVDTVGNRAEVRPSWRIEGGIGSINDQGVFKAGVVGTGTARATLGSVEAEVRIDVGPGHTASVVVVPDRVEVPAGRSYHFAARGLDDHGNETEIEAEWSVTPGIGTMDSAGRFTATMAGEGTVLATFRDLVGQAAVSTIPGRLAALEVLPAEVRASSGSTQQFFARGADVHGNALSDEAVSWSVSGDVGTIDAKTGRFTAVKAGMGTIVAVSGQARGSVGVTVVPGDPSARNSRISVSRTSLPADGTTSAEIVITVRDAFSNPISGTGVTVTSSRADDIVTASAAETDENGTVKCTVASRAPGETLITAVAGGVSLSAAGPIEFK